MRPYFILMYLLFLVVLGAAGDGADNSGHQTIGHALTSLEFLAAFSAVFIFKIRSYEDFIAILATYICLRVAGFDYMRNVVAGQELFYLGGNNLWDNFFIKFPTYGVTFMRVIFLIAGISVPIKYLKSQT